MFARARPAKKTVEGSLKELRHLVAIRYSIEGDLRFISHHDTLRMLERALARAELPIRFSEGFNPRPRMSIALPRPVGVASSDETVLVELTEPVSPESILERLGPQMPAGCCVLSVLPTGATGRPRACEAEYELALDADALVRLAPRVAAFVSAREWVVNRSKPGALDRRVDIRSFIHSMQCSGEALTWTQSVTQAGTARIGEVLDALDLGAAEHLHRVRRTRVRYES